MQIAIVLYPGLTTLDAIGPYEVLRYLPDAEIRFVAKRPGPVLTDSRVLVLGATHSFEETPTPDVILVPGSEAETGTAMQDAALIQWLKKAHTSSVWTTSVCTGALVLASAGILKGHQATTHWIAQDVLDMFGAISRPNERIVRSGKVLTAAGVSAGIDLALHLGGMIAGTEWAESVQLILEYDPQPPHASGHPTKASNATVAAARAEIQRRAEHRLDQVVYASWSDAIGAARCT